jgi:hypothetical protein
MATTRLNRYEFWVLHQKILEKCYGEKAHKMLEKPDTVLYGYEKGHAGPSYENSIKGIIERTLMVSVNCRQLKDHRVAFDKKETDFYFTGHLLKQLLEFTGLDLENLKNEPHDAPKTIKSFDKKQERVAKKRLATEIDKRLQKFINTSWWFYFKEGNRKGLASVFRLVFKVEDYFPGSEDLIVKLINKGEPYTNFTGRIVKEQCSLEVVNCVLLADDQELKVKHRNLMFRIDNRGKKGMELYAGTYTMYSEEIFISSNLVIIQRVKDLDEKMEPKQFFLGTEEIREEIDSRIIDFFYEFPFKLNVPSGIFSLIDLENKTIAKKMEREVEEPSPVWDLYISFPVTALRSNPEKLKSLNVEVKEMVENKLFKEMGINKIYIGEMDLGRLVDPSIILKRELKELRRSKACLFIFPNTEPIITSVTTLAGCAIYSNKPTFLIADAPRHLPTILKGADTLEHVKIPSIHNPVKIRDIPKWLKDNEYFLMISN